ncbi:MAG: hypothetical protein QF464_16570, partial [Myxococcota bacterium]|nr:hypothetical protein [Myxococcota bacterium]
MSAGASGWSIYSIIHVNARNITVYLKSTEPASGPPTPIEYPPDAILRGRVIGLDKYVVAPPGPCNAMPLVVDAADCEACTSDQDCGEMTHDCVDLLEQGSRCLRHCAVHDDCPGGYVCAGFSDDVTRCMPSPGEKIAKCGVTPRSVFSQDIYPPETGWVHVGETYELPSTRLGELAVVCYGGYRASNGVFTATALGVRRHVYATAGATIEGLDVLLTHPLDRTFRLRVLDAPAWPDGNQDPAITLSIDLGADGAIPMTRPVFGGADDQWRVARQLGELSGELYDASYAIYARISANTQDGTPTSYVFKQKIASIVATRLPYHDGDAWQLDSSGLEDDLHGLWASPDGRFTAVGAGGVLLFHNGQSWYEQSSGTAETLHDVDGAAWDDQWAVGARGVVLRWAGLAWQAVEAPDDTYHAVATAAGLPAWFAGDVRLRRRDLDGSWHIDGPPWLQGIRDLDVAESGLVVGVGPSGRAYMRTPAGVWSYLSTGVETDLLAVSLNDDTGEIA